MEFQYIDDDQGLKEFCAGISDCAVCALDTEFLREKTYFPVLALIQLATEQGQQACIDPLSIDDFTPLIDIFNNQKITKVFHSPSQDLELFYQQFEALPKPIFDTQLAASVLGYANQIGYADLVNRLCNVQLEKKYTRADWTRRPLSEGELDYAMDDVRYLLPLFSELTKELESKGRLSWVQADFDSFSDMENYKLDETQLWKKLKGAQRLKGINLNNADLLCRWREKVAIAKNRPRRWIMKDEDIVDIARFKPKNKNDLADIRNLNSGYIAKYGDEILQVLQQSQATSETDYPRHPEFIKLTTQQQAVADCLMAICRNVTEANQISLASVATKKDIDQLVVGKKDGKLSKGWRYKMVGLQLQNFVDGKSTLSCRNDCLRLADC